MMNCQQINKLLERYDEGDLPAQIAVQVEAHIQNCADCQTRLRLVNKERTRLQSYDDIPDLAPDFAGKVMARIEVSPRPAMAPLVPIWVEWTQRYPTLIGAVAVILLFIFPVIGQPQPNTDMIPVASAPAVKQIAAIDKAQNVAYNAGLEQAAVAEVSKESLLFDSAPNEFGYRNEARPLKTEDPSRSLKAKSPSAETAMPAEPMMAMRSINPADADTTADELNIPAVVPSYIPEGFHLDKIEIASDNQVTISYLPIDSEKGPLVINITPDRAVVTALKQDSNDTGSEPEKTLPTADVNAAPPPPSLSTQGNYQGYNYLITYNQPLNDTEITNLINSLTPHQSQ